MVVSFPLLRCDTGWIGDVKLSNKLDVDVPPDNDEGERKDKVGGSKGELPAVRVPNNREVF